MVELEIEQVGEEEREPRKANCEKELCGKIVELKLGVSTALVCR